LGTREEEGDMQLTPEIMRARAANRPLLPFLLLSFLIAGCGFAAPWRFDAHKAMPFFLWMQAAPSSFLDVPGGRMPAFD
jgi:hypothetical protein